MVYLLVLSFTRNAHQSKNFSVRCLLALYLTNNHPRLLIRRHEPLSLIACDIGVRSSSNIDNSGCGKDVDRHAGARRIFFACPPRRGAGFLPRLRVEGGALGRAVLRLEATLRGVVLLSDSPAFAD